MDFETDRYTGDRLPEAYARRQAVQRAQEVVV